MTTEKMTVIERKGNVDKISKAGKPYKCYELVGTNFFGEKVTKTIMPNVLTENEDLMKKWLTLEPNAEVLLEFETVKNPHNGFSSKNLVDIKFGVPEGYTEQQKAAWNGGGSFGGGNSGGKTYDSAAIAKQTCIKAVCDFYSGKDVSIDKLIKDADKLFTYWRSPHTDITKAPVAEPAAVEAPKPKAVAKAKPAPKIEEDTDDEAFPWED